MVSAPMKVKVVIIFFINKMEFFDGNLFFFWFKSTKQTRPFLFLKIFSKQKGRARLVLINL